MYQEEEVEPTQMVLSDEEEDPIIFTPYSLPKKRSFSKEEEPWKDIPQSPEFFENNSPEFFENNPEMDLEKEDKFEQIMRDEIKINTHKTIENVLMSILSNGYGVLYSLSNDNNHVLFLPWNYNLCICMFQKHIVFSHKFKLMGNNDNAILINSGADLRDVVGNLFNWFNYSYEKPIAISILSLDKQKQILKNFLTLQNGNETFLYLNSLKKELFIVFQNQGNFSTFRLMFTFKFPVQTFVINGKTICKPLHEDSSGNSSEFVYKYRKQYIKEMQHILFVRLKMNL